MEYRNLYSQGREKVKFNLAKAKEKYELVREEFRTKRGRGLKSIAWLCVGLGLAGAVLSTQLSDYSTKRSVPETQKIEFTGEKYVASLGFPSRD